MKLPALSFVVLTAVCCVLCASACPAVTMKSDAGRPPECETRADCKDGKVCTAEKYCDACATSGQCSVKEQCSDTTKRCVLRDGWGSECSTNEACQAGGWCKQGLCLPRADVNLCPTGMNASCPQGERCNTLTTVCEEDLGCSTKEDCSAQEVCNTGSRLCVPRCTPDTQASVCGAGERCVNERCVQCTQASECGVGLICDLAGKCSTAERCYSDRDCMVPLACFLQTGACLPKRRSCTSNDVCPPDQRCDVGAQRCVPKTCQPDRFEPNDEQGRAFGVMAGTFRGMSLCNGDQDWFGLQLGRGDLLGVNLDADPFSEATFSTVIKDASGRTVAAGRLLVSYVAPAASRYFVVISSIDPFQTYDATFLLSRGTPCDDDTNEPNDSPTLPTVLNAQTQIDGKICQQDQDHFRVAVAAGQGVKVSLVNYEAGRGLLSLCLLSNDGMTSLGCSDDVGPQVTASASQVGGQNVIVRVRGSTERITNAYTLKVEPP
jgi:hypothetical protein